MSLKKAVEAVVNRRAEDEEKEADFNMGDLYNEAWPLIEADKKVSDALTKLQEVGKRPYRKLGAALLRNVFLIELVKTPKIETTKFRTRWFEELAKDPRYCSFDECLAIAQTLISELPNWISKKNNREAISLSLENGLIPYEIPLDYKERLTKNKRLHEFGNLAWCDDSVILRTLQRYNCSVIHIWSLRKIFMEMEGI